MKVKLGVFSLSASSPDGDDSRYLRWHHLDHLPQQYEVAGHAVRPALGVDARVPGAPTGAVGAVRTGQPRGALPLRRARRPGRRRLLRLARPPDRDRPLPRVAPQPAGRGRRAGGGARGGERARHRRGRAVPAEPRRVPGDRTERPTGRRARVGRPSMSNGCSRSTASPGSGRSRPPRCGPTSSARAVTASRCATSTKTR